MSDHGVARRLIESAFPLRETSIDSVHEKNVRHGHISTLHVWPARRPLAASRAVLLATLLDDPGSDGPRWDLLRRIGGDVVKKETERGEREETIGGVLHWGRESSPELARLREQVREAFGGRAPRVLDPFAGGGAIPLEAMRLGCEVTASDLNPVAWFILRCTLHYPRLMAGQTRPLPDIAVRDRPFVEAFLEAQGIRRKSDLRSHLTRLGHGDGSTAQQTSFDVGRPEASADFPWHLRAWGRRVLAGARRELASCYPTRAEFEPVKRKGRRGRPLPAPRRFKPRPPKILTPDVQGRASVDPLNAEFDSLYLEDPAQPPLGRQAHGGVPVGSDRRVRRLPGRDSPPEDALALQARRQARAARDDAARRRKRGGARPRIGCSEEPRRRRPRRRHHEPKRRQVPVLRRYRNDAGPAGARARWKAGRAHDGGGDRWAGGEGVSAAERRGTYGGSN